jgi:hypothetical protein
MYTPSLPFGQGMGKLRSPWEIHQLLNLALILRLKSLDVADFQEGRRP